MTVVMSEKAARSAGLLAPKSRKTRKVGPRSGAVTRCCTCGDTFTGDASETRHVEQVHHHRYETVLT